MYWWWDTFIDPQDQWYQYGTVSTFFAGADLATLTPGKGIVSGDAQAFILQNPTRALLWLRNNDYSIPAAQAAYDTALFAAIRSKSKLTDWIYEPPFRCDVTVALATTHIFTIILAGINEVPGPGDTDGRGHAQVTLNSDSGEVCYEIAVENIAIPTAGHIHQAAEDAAGGVVVNLLIDPAMLTKCVTADPAVVAAIVADPANYTELCLKTVVPLGGSASKKYGFQANRSILCELA